ncbi:MAG: hypothetical protein F6J93_40490, partial [Oscillatoria sp. SIO1A7]|nr:hypothetical protein [Oscillatoria sp. SIO1A7]
WRAGGLADEAMYGRIGPTLTRSPFLTPSLPISPHLSPSLPISPHLSPSLPISPHLSPSLPISPHPPLPYCNPQILIVRSPLPLARV